MQFLPTIELTPQVRLMLGRGALSLQPGQWVRGERGIGRYLRTDTRTGVSYVSWVRPEDSFEDAAKRFGRACRKGFIGKYGRLYDRVKAEREQDRVAWADMPSIRPAPVVRASDAAVPF